MKDPLRMMMIEFYGRRTLDQWLEATKHLDPALVRETFASVTQEDADEAQAAGGVRW